MVSLNSPPLQLSQLPVSSDEGRGRNIIPRNIQHGHPYFHATKTPSVSPHKSQYHPNRYQHLNAPNTAISPFGTPKNVLSHSHSSSRPGSLSRPSSLSRPGSLFHSGPLSRPSSLFRSSSLSHPGSPLQPNLPSESTFVSPIQSFEVFSPIQSFEDLLPQDYEDIEMESHESELLFNET